MTSWYEALIERRIREAQERGDFDHLPGAGKPLPGQGTQDDDLWWLRGYLRREGISVEAMLPASLRLARQLEKLPETVRNLPSEYAVRERVASLNREIEEYRRAPTTPHVPLRPVDPEEIVAQWRERKRVP
ncbi:MAG TPA: DUF1992 domain-containing protein [Natronosporangium sp.]